MAVVEVVGVVLVVGVVVWLVVCELVAEVVTVLVWLVVTVLVWLVVGVLMLKDRVLETGSPPSPLCSSSAWRLSLAGGKVPRPGKLALGKRGHKTPVLALPGPPWKALTSLGGT